VLLPRLAGSLAGPVGRGRPDVRRRPGRRRAHPFRDRRPGRAGRDRPADRQAQDRRGELRRGRAPGPAPTPAEHAEVTSEKVPAPTNGGGAADGEMLRLEQVVKRYGDFTAVAGIDLSVRRGEIFGFLGPNGAGKTTTIRMVAGVLQPTSGRITVGGND